MAKYAQGFERKNSDTKNLIILFSVIVGVVLLAIAAVILYNTLHTETHYTYSDQAVLDYNISTDLNDNGYYYAEGSNSKLLDGNKYVKDGACYYFIYTASDDEATIKAVIDYCSAYNEGEASKPLYIFTLPTDETKKTELHKALGLTQVTLDSGYLIEVENNAVKNVTTKDVKAAIQNLNK